MRVLLFLLLSAQLSIAEPPTLKLTLATEKPKAGYPVKVSAETTAKAVRFRVVGDATPVPDSSGRFLHVVPHAGTVTVLAVAASDTGELSEFAEATFTVDGTPVPPPSPDTLTATVKAALVAETSATKEADRTALAAVYRALPDAAKDANVKTAAQLFAVVKGATEARIEGRLKPVRQLFGAELAKILPADTEAVLTAAHREAAGKSFARFADILEGTTNAR